MLAPASVVAVWAKDLEAFADFDYTVACLAGSKKKRLLALSELTLPGFEGTLLVAVINYESAWRDTMAEALAEYHADLVICDESQRIKTHTAELSKGAHELGDIARYRLILSGTPIQNQAIDLFSQYRFLDTSVFGSNFYRFRDRYCIMGGFQEHQIIAYKCMDELIRKTHSCSYRVTKEEALDLPEQTFERRYVSFRPSERKLYNDMRKSGIAELEQEETITATIVLTKLLKLQQITGGFVPNDDGTLKHVSTAKLDALLDILESYVIGTGRKLVIFARFTPEIEAIEGLCKRMRIPYGAINGSVPTEKRGAIVEDFQTNADTKVFIAQLQCAGLGITLTAASVAVYYSTSFNYADYSQSLARIHRIGQKQNCHYIHILVEESIDDYILEALEKKQDLAKSIVDDWKKYF